MAKPGWKTPSAIFLVTFVALLLYHGNRLVFTNDEGIILEPAQRMAAGARPYVDFFGYMSPGSYWLQNLAFRSLGISLWAGRLIVILDFSLQCALLFWLTARLASSKAAWVVLATFAGFQIADPTFLTAQHRWDSATLALAGLCVAVYALNSTRTGWWVLSGGLLAFAAWCTPSMVLVAGAAAIWLIIARERRSAVIPFAVGILAVTVIAVTALAVAGCLPAFLKQMAWLQQHYSVINVMPYGSVIGGYSNLFRGADGGFDLAVRTLLVVCLALPAILPPVAAVLWGIALWRRKVLAPDRAVVVLLLAATACLAITAFPRADIVHLGFVAALPYALVAAGAAHYLGLRAGVALGTASMLLAGLFAANNWTQWRATQPLATPVGTLRVAIPQRPDLERLLTEVHPGQSLFVYPYMPLHYFLTQAKNPTRYYYLQPGMMTDREASEALAELQARPPQWLLYQRLTREEFARVFPFAPSLDWRFEQLEGWLEKNYQPIPGPAVTVAGYKLWQRITPSPVPAQPRAWAGTGTTPLPGTPPRPAD